jgi:hypothetical protein
MPDLGRGFSPARADCGYRAPLAPRLARPSRWYRAMRSTTREQSRHGHGQTCGNEGQCERVTAIPRAGARKRSDARPRRARRHRRWTGGGARDDDSKRISLCIDGDAHATIPGGLVQRKGEECLVGHCTEGFSGHVPEGGRVDHACAAEGGDGRDSVPGDALRRGVARRRILVLDVNSPDADFLTNLWDLAA